MIHYIFVRKTGIMNIDIDYLTEEAVELLKLLIQTPSTSREETKAADLLEMYLQERGIETNRDGNNVWCMAPGYDYQKPTLLLNSHIDTVKPVSTWKRDPFGATVEQGKLYGLGSNDAGASLVSLLQVFRELSKSNQPYNLIFLASAEEEVSGKNGIEMILPQLPPIQVALVGEPTQMQPAIAEKGLMVLDVTAYGKSGHAARNEGINAIYQALEDIQWFRDYRFEQESDLLGPVKMSVTVIQSGTQHNVIPDQCHFVVDVRSNEKYSNQQIYDTVCQHIKSQAKARSFRLNSSAISPEHPIIKRAVELGKHPFGSPTLSDQALMHFPSLKMGPGHSSRSHTADEYIEIKEIEEAIVTYYRLLHGLNLD